MGESMAIVIVVVSSIVGGLILAFIATGVEVRRRRALASRQRFHR